MGEHTARTFVGMDVHQRSISLAILGPDGELCEDKIPPSAEAVRKIFERLGPGVRACYEAGPAGYGLQRQLAELGVDCSVVAPSLIPRRPGRRVKTDQRDARSLVGLLRAGELTAVRVPSPEDEAVRDLIRAREDLGEDILRARHRLSKFLLRHGRVYGEGKSWTMRHQRWLQRQRFDQPVLDQLLEHLIAQVHGRLAQRDALDREIEALASSPAYAEAVARLSCLRGISTLSAITLLVEIGDFRRFASAPSLMAFTGLVPSEHSSGERRNQGSITKTGNAHLRRILVEAAWTYRSKAEPGSKWLRRLRGQPPAVLSYVLGAQARLHSRYWRLVHRGKPTVTVTVAVARELTGFVWGLMNERYTTAGA